MIRVSSIKDKYILQYGSEKIPFKVEFRERKHLSIDVHPDGQVIVIAPQICTLDEVYKRVEKRAHWIAKQCVHFETFRPLPKEKRYISGETHLYLGRQYRLKIQSSSEESIKLIGRYLHVFTFHTNNALQVEALLIQWYKNHAKGIFDARLDWCIENALSLRIPRPNISIRKMERRWGSCSRAGKILLNLDLVKTPLHCIEYVIMHELCHLRIHDHSPAYYRLLARCIPDWKKRKERLNTFII
jgi:predicted metal-dependent hydrolase